MPGNNFDWIKESWTDKKREKRIRPLEAEPFSTRKELMKLAERKERNWDRERFEGRLERDERKSVIDIMGNTTHNGYNSIP